MAQGKKSFLFYCDWQDSFEQLPDDKAGELIKFMLAYVNDEDPETDDVLINAVFATMKNQLKRDLKKWEKRADRARENGKKGGRPKKTEQNPIKPTGFSENPKKPVTDTVIVTDIVNSNSYSNNIINCYEKCLLHFPEHLHPKSEKAKKNWLETIDKLNRLDNIPYEAIEQLTAEARGDQFWAKNFLSLVKLRKKNPDGVPYIVVFHENFSKYGKPKDNRGASLEEVALAWSKGLAES